MKLITKPLLCLTAVFGVTPHTIAQTFATLHNFSGSDGASPYAGLLVSGNTLYGTTHLGGGSQAGTVFKIQTDGTGFKVIYNFSGGTDGAQPLATLVLDRATLYGTTVGGGQFGAGTVFKLNTNGTGFTNLYSFTGGDDGSQPNGGLVLVSNTLYGTTYVGGPAQVGTVFAINTNGTGFNNLHAFTGDDGGHPRAGLTLATNTLYGTTEFGGDSGNGTLYSINTDGSGFTNFYNFTAYSGPMPSATNSDGEGPWAGLILSRNTLYGTASGGGASGLGTVFAINTDGTGFTNLHNFIGDSGGEGADPDAGLVLYGNTLYGTTVMGGISDSGTVFSVSIDGTLFQTLHRFSGATDNCCPTAALALSGNALYGTTWAGGSTTAGTAFSISLPEPPQLAITPAGASVVLTWSTNYTGFSLQSTTNLTPPSIWTTNLPPPVVANGKNTVTNAMTATHQFYRLIQ